MEDVGEIKIWPETEVENQENQHRARLCTSTSVFSPKQKKRDKGEDAYVAPNGRQTSGQSC